MGSVQLSKDCLKVNFCYYIVDVVVLIIECALNLKKKTKTFRYVLCYFPLIIIFYLFHFLFFLKAMFENREQLVKPIVQVIDMKNTTMYHVLQLTLSDGISMTSRVLTDHKIFDFFGSRVVPNSVIALEQYVFTESLTHGTLMKLENILVSTMQMSRVIGSPISIDTIDTNARPQQAQQQNASEAENAVADAVINLTRINDLRVGTISDIRGRCFNVSGGVFRQDNTVKKYCFFDLRDESGSIRCIGYTEIAEELLKKIKVCLRFYNRFCFDQKTN